MKTVLDKIFYVYEWYNVDTGEVFYVGKVMAGDLSKSKVEINILSTIIISIIAMLGKLKLEW